MSYFKPVIQRAWGAQVLSLTNDLFKCHFRKKISINKNKKNVFYSTKILFFRIQIAEHLGGGGGDQTLR